MKDSSCVLFCLYRANPQRRILQDWAMMPIYPPREIKAKDCLTNIGLFHIMVHPQDQVKTRWKIVCIFSVIMMSSATTEFKEHNSKLCPAKQRHHYHFTMVQSRGRANSSSSIDLTASLHNAVRLNSYLKLYPHPQDNENH